MKKLIAAAIFAFCLSVHAQTKTLFWTNSAPVFTNVPIGAISIPLSSNGLAGVSWTVGQWNTTYGLSGTNQFSASDLVKYACWYVSELWGQQAIEAANARNAAVAIRAALSTATSLQLSNVCVDLGIPFLP